jgi:hypothetical protein
MRPCSRRARASPGGGPAVFPVAAPMRERAHPTSPARGTGALGNLGHRRHPVCTQGHLLPVARHPVRVAVNTRDRPRPCPARRGVGRTAPESKPLAEWVRSARSDLEPVLIIPAYYDARCLPAAGRLVTALLNVTSICAQHCATIELRFRCSFLACPPRRQHRASRYGRDYQDGFLVAEPPELPMHARLPPPDALAAIVSGVTETMLGADLQAGSRRHGVVAPGVAGGGAFDPRRLPRDRGPVVRPPGMRSARGEMFRVPPDQVSDAMLSDSLCELLNMIAGLLKSHLAARAAPGAAPGVTAGRSSVLPAVGQEPVRPGGAPGAGAMDLRGPRVTRTGGSRCPSS